MSSNRLQPLSWTLVLVTASLASLAEDLHIKKNISINGNFVSTTDTAVKGARERNVTQTPGGNTVTIRQCDLKRTLTLNEQGQTYFVANDPQDESAARAAALITGAATAEAGGKIDVTTTVTDTGERKQMFGYAARHLKTVVTEESSAKACAQVHQKFEIDGWYADIAKEQTGCQHFLPPVREGENCHDTVISHHSGSGKPGYPLSEVITIHDSDSSPLRMEVTTSELTKETLQADLFDVPAGYRQVSSVAELQNIAEVTQSAVAAPAQPQAQQITKTKNPLAQALMGQKAAFASPLGLTQGGMPNMGGMPATGGTTGGAPVAAPQVLGPKAPGKIRVGVAPPDAQLGQGNNAGADYSTPIRNAMVALMNGPAVEIAALDSHIAMQVQAEAQQKQCDYILYSSVAVKHGSSGGFGKFMKMAAPVANMTPMGVMAHGMGSAAAVSAASAAASAAAMSAQQQAISQLAGFNGQIKSKDDVTVLYQLVPSGQTTPRLQNSLQSKAKSDGEDVLTPLLQQAATSVLTEATKK